MWVSHKGAFTQYVPDSTTILESLFLRQVDGRTLDHEGIEFDCLIYNSLDMRIIRSKFGCKLKVNIRVNDEDLSYIYVQVPDHDIWVKVPCLDLEYSTDLTRWQHKKCKKMQDICADDGVELSLAEARQQLLDDIDAEKTAVTQGRKKARARLRERPKKSAPAATDESRQPEPSVPNETEDQDQTDRVPDPVPQLDVDFFERRSA
jgi:putative transposase